MKPVGQAIWLARFEMEALVSAILRNGMLLSSGLVVAALIIQWAGHGPSTLGPNLQAKSLPLLVLQDLGPIWALRVWPRLLTHWGVVVLLLTPYARVLASMVYFAVVARSGKHAVLAGLVLVMVTVVLLTRWL